MMSEHVHDYRPVIVRHNGWEMISGYRCVCGAPPPWPSVSVQDQIRWGLAYMRQRYGDPGLGLRAWEAFADEANRCQQLRMREEAVARGGYD